MSHAFYMDKEGHKHIRMKFHLKGTAHTGTAHLDMVEVFFFVHYNDLNSVVTVFFFKNDSGKYEYRFLFVEVDDLFKTVIIVEDNRNKLNFNHPPTTTELDLKF